MRSTTTTGLKRQLKNGWKSTFSNFKNDFVCLCVLCAYDTFDISIPPARWMEVYVLCVCPDQFMSIHFKGNSINWLQLVLIHLIWLFVEKTNCWLLLLGGPIQACDRTLIYFTGWLMHWFWSIANFSRPIRKPLFQKLVVFDDGSKFWTSNVNRRWPFYCVL